MNEIDSCALARVDLKDTRYGPGWGEHLYVDGSYSEPSDGVCLCGYDILTQKVRGCMHIV